MNDRSIWLAWFVLGFTLACLLPAARHWYAPGKHGAPGRAPWVGRYSNNKRSNSHALTLHRVGVSLLL